VRSWSRRAVLASAAATVALPFLPSLWPRRAVAETATPKRLLFWYVPNGMHMPAWTPTTEGVGWEETPLLAPLAAHRADLTILSGLENPAAFGGDRPMGHSRGTAAHLTCVTPRHDAVGAGVSVDQVYAAVAGASTRFPSVHVNGEPPLELPFCEGEYPCAYANTVSWSGPTTPVLHQTSPQLLLRQLFAGFDPAATAASREAERRLRRSLLDHVTGEATSLRGRLSPTDAARLDEYLTGVRQVERLLVDDGVRCDSPVLTVADDPTSNLDALTELVVLALQCDLTRVATVMTGNSASGRTYPFLGVPEPHHDLSHHAGDPAKQGKLVTIGRWEVERFARLLQRLAEVPDGDGRLLDACAVVFGSEMSDGNVHDQRGLPVLVAGRAGGALAPGGHMRHDGRDLADLYQTVLAAVGAPAGPFAALGSGPLEGLGG
jgi:hypothetical protein